MKLQSLSQSFNISFTDSIYQFEAVDMNHDYRFSRRSKPSIPVPLAVSVVKLSLTVISVCINGIMQASSDFCRHVELHCGYLFGLPVGIVVDSVGATVGAAAAFLLGGTVKVHDHVREEFDQHIVKRIKKPGVYEVRKRNFL
ncbi:uncharacterized protein LOC123892325 [Trifolium pratense]|uniref:uncharacterized protein LOC123892325 n=1 Tax=Trifolium pratense TaxID=57577 RepID=UPI001E6942E9|nr:uncharacterized protein LOC123892325 [Trifolium pratense]